MVNYFNERGSGVFMASMDMLFQLI